MKKEKKKGTARNGSRGAAVNGGTGKFGFTEGRPKIDDFFEKKKKPRDDILEC